MRTIELLGACDAIALAKEVLVGTVDVLLGQSGEAAYFWLAEHSRVG